MQPFTWALILLALVCGPGVADGAALSPVTRVVEILKSLSVKIEHEGKAEEELYETFVCWAKSILSQKGKSNTAAQSRADQLSTYIDDLSSGRIELTSERVDLERQIAALTGDLELAQQTREKEQKDYEDAKAEMEKAIAALTSAVEVLQEATAEHTQGVLLSFKNGAGEGFTARAKEAASLEHAAELGEKVLTKGDAVFLRRLLTGEVPVADWKKLNRKATFKQGYKARSFKIQEVLAKLLEDFAGNLDAATKKEQEAVALYDKLTAAKTDEKNAALDALANMQKENGAKAQSLEEATTEKNDLLAQIQADTAYIADVQKALADKTAEWKVRQTLRTGELGAISKAVAILHSDDAADLFKKSYASQGYLFLQEGASTARTRSAVEVVRAAARRAHDSRLFLVAADMARGHFDEVIAAIDSMLDVLKTEEESDLHRKETCEADRATDTRSAIKASRTIDELTDTISALKAKIAALTAEIHEKQERVAEIEKELAEAAAVRQQENKEYLASKADDEAAADLVSQAKAVLEQFYKDNGLVFAQKNAQPFASKAGAAPPPPPPTWEAPYGGKVEEQNGIVAILGMIHEDILEDVAKATEEEDQSEALYQKTKTDLETEENDLNTSINDLQQAASTAATDVETNTQSRMTKHGELDVVMKKIADAAPGCDFFTINYPLRLNNRQIEIDGLEKAKAILTGATFDAPDPNRAIKPGDAASFLGTRRKFLRSRLA